MIIRTVDEKDKPMLAEWVSKEPAHSETKPEFYFEPKTKSVVYEDEFGPVFAVRYSSALVIDIEFNPDVDKQRIREMLKQGFPDVARQAQSQGFKHLIFSSTSKMLIAFCRLFGFLACPDYRKSL